MKNTLVYALACILGAGSVNACSRGPAADARGQPSQPGSEHSLQRAVEAASHPVEWSVTRSAASATSGGIINIRVDAAIQRGWHIYSITQPAGGPRPTRITVPAGQPFVPAGEPHAVSPPQTGFDEAFKMNVELHKAAAAFIVPVRFSGATPATSDSVHVNVRYQACNASLCLPPQTARLVLSVPQRTE